MSKVTNSIANKNKNLNDKKNTILKTNELKSKQNKEKGTNDTKDKSTSKKFDFGNNLLKKISNFLLLSNISIVNVIRIGFGILLVDILINALITFNGLNDLKTAFDVISNKATPLTLESKNLESNLLSLHNQLNLLLMEKKAENVDDITKHFNELKEIYISTLNDFKKKSDSNKIIKDTINNVSLLSEKYLQETEKLPSLKKELIIKSLKINKDKAAFLGLTKTLNREETSIFNKIDDDFIKDSALNLLAAQNIMENATIQAFNAETEDIIEKSIKTNLTYLKEFNINLNDVRSEVKTIDNDIGTYLKAFVYDTTDPNGVLNQYKLLVSKQLEAEERSENAKALINKIRDCIVQVQEITNAIISEKNSDASQIFTKSQLIQMFSLAIAMFIAGFIANIVGSSIRIPLNKILNSISIMGSGDFSKNLDHQAKNEFGQLSAQVNKLRTQFSNILKQISDDSEKVNAAADANQSSASKTMEGIQNQQKMTDSVVSSVDELRDSSNLVAQSASQTHDIVVDATEIANEGCKVINANIESTEKLSSKLKDTAVIVNRVNEMSNNISSVIQVIRDVSEQTNLLALNAAIEAARAGEHGRGFAVVADEVRTLANKTGESTNQIKKVIDGLQISVNNAVVAMNECGKEMENSIQQTSNVNDAITKIQNSLHNINDYSTQIVSAAETQKVTTDKVAESIHDIVDISNRSADEISNVAQACITLNDLAKKQTDEVKKFVI